MLGVFSSGLNINKKKITKKWFTNYCSCTLIYRGKILLINNYPTKFMFFHTALFIITMHSTSMHFFESSSYMGNVLTRRNTQGMVVLVPQPHLDTDHTHHPHVYRSGAGCDILFGYSPDTCEYRNEITK